MEASLQAFQTIIEKKSANKQDVVFVLGDMNELGNFAPEGHKRIGKLLADFNQENCFFIGRYASHYQDGYGIGGKLFPTLAEFHSTWQQLRSEKKYFFIKGSRSLQLESLMDIK
jgi:UDP-N-acetylmuramoyl-tripeptide--D-alanyl-D-alanine ligase